MSAVDIEQGSEAWHRIRIGRVTASRIADVIARTKSGWSTSRANYAAEIIAERLTGEEAASYVSAPMQWGLDKEPEARSAYEFRKDVGVTLVGFAFHPTIKDTGASPDGYVAQDGSIQIKCPLTATHLDTLQGQPISERYITQIQWEMACSGRKWCDFVSYDPRLPEALRLFIKRVPRDNVLIADLEKCVTAFLAEINDRIRDLSKTYGVKPVALFSP